MYFRDFTKKEIKLKSKMENDLHSMLIWHDRFGELSLEFSPDNLWNNLLPLSLNDLFIVISKEFPQEGMIKKNHILLIIWWEKSSKFIVLFIKYLEDKSKQNILWLAIMFYRSDRHLMMTLLISDNIKNFSHVSKTMN